jgi:hypothetical protein
MTDQKYYLFVVPAYNSSEPTYHIYSTEAILQEERYKENLKVQTNIINTTKILERTDEKRVQDWIAVNFAQEIDISEPFCKWLRK